MTAPQDPRQHYGLPPEYGTDPQDGPAVTDDITVRLPHPDQSETVRLDSPADTLHFAPEIRFGPGVPSPARTGAHTSRSAAEVWHGTARPHEPSRDDEHRRRRRRRRPLGGWLLPLVVLIAVLAYLAWQRSGPTLAVTGVGIRTAPAGPGCNGTAAITGTLRTNGGSGDVTYRWIRSDGTVSETLHQHIARGARRTDVVLRWSFDGQGTLRATATLEVLSPDPLTASTAFPYRCR
ncbi:hypothetical protein [Streptomyces sp. NPDC048277]|uniref:hypothetical protein n=1 Tax=Streptomyces sp. NPDC048277 TaxID=3155027 RepID=UPI00340DE75F